MQMSKASVNRTAPLTSNENERLLALHDYCILDTPPEPVFEQLTAIGCALFGTPIVLISLVDEHHQFFKSVVGLAQTGTSRDSSFCAYTILGDEPLVVLDALNDVRFQNNPLVLGPPCIRFYAGAPLIDGQGYKLGSFCVISDKPRAVFSAEEQQLLLQFASLTVNALEQRLYPARVERAEQALLAANERYRLATRATTDGIWDWDFPTGVLYYSGRLRSIVGLPDEEHWGSVDEWIDRLHPQDAILARENLRQMKTSQVPSFESEYRIRHEDGSWRWVHNRGIAVRASDGEMLRLTGAIRDVTLDRTHDDLTGLHSRVALHDALESLLNSSRRECCVVLSIDFDRFKRVNDSLGHNCGDLLLIEAAKRIQQTLGLQPLNMAARIVGDNFAVLLSDVDGEEQALAYADRLQALIQTPTACGDQSVRVSASIGMVLADRTYAAPEQLLHDADIAMHQAKAKGGAQSAVFSKAVREIALQRLKLESELRTALANNEVFLCYQPKVLLHSGEVTGFEALMRWPHAERGLIPPDEFIPLAEETDLILEVGRWTLRESMRQLSIWRAEGLVSPTTTVAVNLSARQFENEQLIPALERKLQMFDLPAECLELEVTEGILILDAQRALKVLQQLKALGVKLDLDDFGTGYSSLSYLQRFPFDSLKVDKSFVRSLPGTEGAAAIAHSIVALGRALNMGIIAEGVELQSRRDVCVTWAASMSRVTCSPSLCGSVKWKNSCAAPERVAWNTHVS